MSRRHKLRTEHVRVKRTELPISFRRPGGEIAEDELEFRAALDNVTAGTKAARDIANLAVYCMYCARAQHALRSDPRFEPEQIQALHPQILAGAEAIDALDKRLRAAGYAKATDAERDALSGLLDVLGEIDRVATSRQQRDAMQRTYGDAAMARRAESKNTSKR
jgi:hypothetical protein